MITTVKVKMIYNCNDTYTWLGETVKWASKYCTSFQQHIDTLEPYIVRAPGDFHYAFDFADQKDANWFTLRWCV